MTSIEILQKFIKDMDTTDISRRIVAENNEKDKQAEVYYKNGELNNDLNVLKQWLKDKDTTKFATDGVYYTETEEESQKSEILVKIINSLYRVKEHDFENWASDFPESGIEYQGCKLSMVYGQGTLYCMEVL